MARALFLGRFQPFHLGHLEVLRGSLEDHEVVILGVGSSQQSHTPENPFTAGERLEMIHRTLEAEDLGPVLPVPIPDLHRNALWAHHVLSLVPRFDVFLSNNGLPRRLFREAGVEVAGVPFHDRERYSGTRIRRLLREGGDWEPLVPEPVAEVIREVEGEARVRDVLRSDDPEGRDG